MHHLDTNIVIAYLNGNQQVAAQLDRASADAYARLRLALRAKGRPTGEVDALIAAVALAHQAVFVTHNTRHFEHIDGLKIEDWL